MLNVLVKLDFRMLIRIYIQSYIIVLYEMFPILFKYCILFQIILALEQLENVLINKIASEVLVMICRKTELLLKSEQVVHLKTHFSQQILDLM
jgi:hypothetical protein